jgi:hypothetical protein
MSEKAKKLGEKLASEITMRDYIAVAAMKAYLSNGSTIMNAKKWAYEAADKMLEESVSKDI